jgi:hypothetical protein
MAVQLLILYSIVESIVEHHQPPPSTARLAGNPETQGETT